MLQIYLLKYTSNPSTSLMCRNTIIITHNTLRNCPHFQNFDFYHLAYELHLEQLKQYYLPPVRKPLDTPVPQKF